MAAVQGHTRARSGRSVARTGARQRSSGAEGERKLREDEQLSKLYRAWKRGKIQALLDGPFGAQVRELDRFMRRMELQDGPRLVDRIRHDMGWIGLMDANARADLLSLISKRIVALRERYGLDPYNDGVYGDPPRAFHQIKDIMGVR